MTTFSVLVLVYIVAAFAVGWWLGVAGKKRAFEAGFDAGASVEKQAQAIAQNDRPWRGKSMVDWSTSRVYGPCADCMDENACFKAAHCMLHEEP